MWREILWSAGLERGGTVTHTVWCGSFFLQPLLDMQMSRKHNPQNTLSWSVRVLVCCGAVFVVVLGRVVVGWCACGGVSSGCSGRWVVLRGE